MMDKKLFSLFVDVEKHPFWLDRPILRIRMKQIFKYIKDLEAEKVKQAERIKELEKAIQDVYDAIHNEGEVNKWKIANWLEQALKG